MSNAAFLPDLQQPDRIAFKISPEDIGKMTSQEVRAAIATHYPNYLEEVCKAYMTGAMTCAVNLGVDPVTISKFLSEWCLYDEQMYVASMFAAAHEKESKFSTMIMHNSTGVH